MLDRCEPLFELSALETTVLKAPRWCVLFVVQLGDIRLVRPAVWSRPVTYVLLLVNFAGIIDRVSSLLARLVDEWWKTVSQTYTYCLLGKTREYTLFKERFLTDELGNAIRADKVDIMTGG